MQYSDKVMDHFQHPRNVGRLDKNDPNVGTGTRGAPACGDVLSLQIKVNDNGVIEDAKCHRFQLFGHRTDQGQDLGRSRTAQKYGNCRRT